jgi:hypothetical protein
LIPVNADVDATEVILIPEEDHLGNLCKSRRPLIMI